VQGTILVNDKTHETFVGATFSTITTLSTVTEVYRALSLKCTEMMYYLVSLILGV